jgi:putative FmdB family regulatory protein
MPTYDYECSACGHKFEYYQSITSKPIRKCPACAKNTVKRLIGTGAGIIFKGSGFYQTDYRSDSYKAGAKADSQTSSTTAKSSDSSAAAKPAESKPKSAEAGK